MAKIMGVSTRPSGLRILRPVLVALALGTLSGCVKPDLRPIGAYEIQKPMHGLLKTVYNEGTHRVYVQEASDAPAQWANGRLPSWADQDYDGCVTWSGTYTVSGQWNSIASGKVYGWIAVDYEMNVHILEISFEEDETGRSGILVDGWADPSAMPGDT